MWNQFSFSQFIPNIPISQFVPAVPQSFYSSAGSTLVAVAAGGAYGLIGRVLYPNIGISPLHYAVWFALAYQIKQFIFTQQKNWEQFLGTQNNLEQVEAIPEDELGFGDLVRFHYWKVLELRNQTLTRIDHVFSRLLNIQPFEEITADNVADASFLEMCRYRIWPVFKATVLDTMSFALAHRLSNGMRFTIPDQTAVPLLLVIRSIVKDIILIPALYMYARLCNQIADTLDDSDEKVAFYRAEWIRRCLPDL